jgi:acyl-CoA thioesterase-1
VSATPPTILVLGDSLSAGYGIEMSAGWVNLLAARLRARGYPYRVVNASISGDTSAGGLARLPGALEAHEPDVVVIELGGNDGLRGLAPARLKGNLAQAIVLARAVGARVLLVGIRIPPNFGPVYTEQIAGVYRDLADETGVALVPFLLDGIALQPGLMQEDGIHPTAAAQPKMLETVWPVLEPLLNEIGG